MYAIEKGIPVPEFSKAPRFPYASLEVGDSFLVEGIKPTSVYGSNHRQNKKTGKKFIARIEDGGVRVWRVE